jgi:hypothetical protein
MIRTTFVLTILMLIVGPSLSYAIPLEIQFTGLDLTYANDAITDSGSPTGGVQDPNDADALDTLEFKIDGVSQGSVLMSDIWADVYIPDVTGLSDVDFDTVILTTGNLGYIDLLIGTSPLAAEYLRLDTEQVTIGYINASSLVQFVFGAAVVSIESKALPFGLEIGDEVTVSFSTRVNPGSKSSENEVVTGFTASGTGEVRGEAVPEPTTALLALVGLLGIGNRSRRGQMC